MKFVSVRDFRSQSANVWKRPKKEDAMVITSNGRPMAAVNSMQLESLQASNDKLSQEEINGEISSARKACRS